MDIQRAILAVILSFAILFGYQYFFVGFEPEQTQVVTQVEGTAVDGSQQIATPQETQAPAMVTPVQPVVMHPEARDITVDTDLYTAVFTENGGALKRISLKEHFHTMEENAPGEELVNSSDAAGYPLKFSWGGAVGQDLLYKATSEGVTFSDGKARLVMEADAGAGLVITRTYTFAKDSYLFDLAVTVRNTSGSVLQGMPQLQQVNTPFLKTGSPADGFLFRGPTSYHNGDLNEVKVKKYKDGPMTLQGNFDWAGYGSHYFVRAIIPYEGIGTSYHMQGDEELTVTTLSGDLDTLQPGAEKTYSYGIYYGPKKVKVMEEIGHNLQKAVNFGFFDFIARPTLWLLNFFYGFVHNYGIAIILVTVLFKAVFWPITQKGMKSMKNMQKLQPKMVKIKEKYKDDPTKMNQEVMGLYKTYKVNPLGGCLPMVLQIPVFFALYKVLLQSIELRHAPFMLWINDLSAPDRLWIGFDIPYLHGIPVLTLMMGASMFIQQKFTPTTADPTQARILMFLPVIFTFMFLNFASGLVLYWFVNNLLSILQQQLINREVAQKAA
ncbi:membrane protein insertase YidC [Desulfosediminicola sp.]|uniref:membrane protein insertase YidC n=1 Tax=Desulfosediminicola sp. TaxID=2886825 RepID=UPI003AF2D17F